MVRLQACPGEAVQRYSMTAKGMPHAVVGPLNSRLLNGVRHGNLDLGTRHDRTFRLCLWRQPCCEVQSRRTKKADICSGLDIDQQAAFRAIINSPRSWFRETHAPGESRHKRQNRHFRSTTLMSELLFPLHVTASLTLAEVAEKTGIHIDTLRKKAKAGLIPGAFQVGGGGWRFKRTALEDWWASLGENRPRRRR
jgi:excisionase family DNA binding protein